ncbi:MAG: transporter substrate-binding domain-containing protein [Pseudomonadota bacterium]
MALYRSVWPCLLLCLWIGWPSVQAAEPIRLVTGQFAPYSGEQLPAGGMLTELVSSVFINLGHPVTVAFLPWNRGYQGVLAGTFTASFPYSFNTERAEDMLFSAPLHADPVQLFVRSDSPLRYATLEDLRGTRLCTALGYNLFPSVQEALNQKLVELITVRDMSSCIRMIETRRADAFFLTVAAGWRLIEENGSTREQFKALPKPIHIAREYLIVAKTYPGAAALINSFNEELQRFIDSGRYQRLLDKHGLGQ